MSIPRNSCNLLAIVALTLAMAACKKSPPEQAGQRNSLSREGAVTVRVMEVTPTAFTETIQLSGTVKAYDDVMISPEEGGVVKEWAFEKGQYVKKGDTIGYLNDDVLGASYRAAAAQYSLAELNYQKQEKVFSEQAVSELQFKSSEFSRDAARAQADLMKARWEHTRLVAPVAGILDDRYKNVGELAPPGVPVARIVNIASVKVAVNIPERYAGTIERGIPVMFSVVAYPGDVFKGTVHYVGAALSADNRTFPIEVILANPGHKLKPEMIARVTIVRAAKQNALVLPEDVVQRLDENRLAVFVEEGGVARERIVQTGGLRANTIEITAGLNPGDRVIVSGYQSVADGQPVEIDVRH